MAEVTRRRIIGNDAARFESYVRVRDDGCWEWTGGRTQAGYGTFRLTLQKNRYLTVLSHRWSYEHYVGPIPEGLHLDHLCRTPACVNPAHLEAVTQGENSRRGQGTAGVLRTHCPQGHPWTGHNKMKLPSRPGSRCRECARLRSRGYYWAQKARTTT